MVLAVIRTAAGAAGSTPTLRDATGTDAHTTDAAREVWRRPDETQGERLEGQCHGNSDSFAVRRRLASSDETDIV